MCVFGVFTLPDDQPTAANRMVWNCFAAAVVGLLERSAQERSVLKKNKKPLEIL